MQNELMQRVMLLIPLILSLTVHEWAHAWSAWKLGDDTASLQGRLSLNPLVHIDPIGTLLLPLLGIPFGWAKPVPVNPARFRRDVPMSTGMMITAAAGPISNIVLAVASTVVMGLLHRMNPDFLTLNPAIRELLVFMLLINVGLAIFNLLPIPPLDGSRIVEGFLPYRFRDSWASFARFAPFVLLAVIVYGRNLLDGPISATHGLLNSLFRVVAGA